MTAKSANRPLEFPRVAFPSSELFGNERAKATAVFLAWFVIPAEWYLLTSYTNGLRSDQFIVASAVTLLCVVSFIAVALGAAYLSSKEKAATLVRGNWTLALVITWSCTTYIVVISRLITFKIHRVSDDYLHFHLREYALNACRVPSVRDLCDTFNISPAVEFHPLSPLPWLSYFLYALLALVIVKAISRLLVGSHKGTVANPNGFAVAFFVTAVMLITHALTFMTKS